MFVLSYLVSLMINLKVKKTKKYGRGVYSLSNIKQNMIIFTDNVLIIPYKGISSKNLISHYWYENDDDSSIISLGNGSLLNHSKNPNVCAKFDKKSQKMQFYALRDIKKGEQLFINYGYDI